MKRISQFLLLLILVFNFQASFAEGEIKGSISVDQARVQNILNKFVSSIGKDPSKYNILVEENEQLNAYATTGRRIVVYTGLINTLMSEAGLAFVVAHELGHIEEHHVFKSLLRNNLFGAVKYFFFRDSLIYDGVNYFHSLHHSRGGERDADLFAEEMVNKFYCKVPGKLEFFESAAAKQQSPKITEYLSTHPLPASRLEYLRGEILAAGCVL